MEEKEEKKKPSVSFCPDTIAGMSDTVATVKSGTGVQEKKNSLPFPIQTEGTCKLKQYFKSLPDSSLEIVYVFHPYTCISYKQEINFYKVFQGVFPVT